MEMSVNITLLTGLVSLLLTGGVFLFAFQAFLLKGVNAMLDAKTKPLEKELSQFKTEMNQFKTEMNQFKTEVNNKLDKLLNK